MAEIVTKEQFREHIRPALKADGKTIALCHGVFDLVHPGHVIHFEQAKEMGDILVVSITAAQYVRKGPDRPYFNDEMRMKFLSAIDSIDYVMLSEGYTVDDIVETVQPDIYVKGSEYAKEEDDLTGKIAEERALVEKYGGELRFTGGQVFSSTKLINTAMSALPADVVEYMKEFKKKYSMEDIRHYADKAEELKVLVIGDIIIDKYTYCIVQGLMSKDMGYSTRLDISEEFLGGAAAVARHLSSFSKDVTLMSIVGNEEEKKEKLREMELERLHLQLVHSSKIPTIVKHRYLSRNQKREEYKKIFSINNIPEFVRYEKAAAEAFKEMLRSKISAYDVVFLCDFGHGLVDEEVMGIVQEKANYLVLNCQTNSSNRGMNIITKYRRADAFTLNQTELQIAFPRDAEDERLSLRKMSQHLNGNGWLTRGAAGVYGVVDDKILDCPAFTLSVKDTVGAGDAFYSVSGIFAAAGAPTEIGTFMGNIGGALGANIVGNKESLEKVNVLKYAGTLMNV